jgi:hypothetical protein
MKLTPHLCPECKKPAIKILEKVEALAILEHHESEGDGDLFEYSGVTDIVWDNQETVVAKDGTVTLSCKNSHEWQAVKTEE